MKITNRKKKAMSILLTLVMIFTLLPATALAAETQTLGDFSVTVESGSASVQNNKLLLKVGGSYTVEMKPDVSSTTMGIAIDGYIYSGGTTPTRITLKDVSFSGLEYFGPVVLQLDGSNVSTGEIRAADDQDNELTISGIGSLTAQLGIHGENITINSGSVTATGGENEPGIGIGGDSTDSCIVTINGGTVTASGGANAAGIGRGTNDGSCTVVISDGTVTATGGDTDIDQTAGAGIGGGMGSITIEVTIRGGTVIATGGNDNYSSGASLTGVAIGGGFDEDGENTEVTIAGGVITVSGGHGYIGGLLIGSSSFNTDESEITITGGGFTQNPRVSGAYLISRQAIGGSVKVKLDGYDIVAAGATQTLNVVPTPNAGYELKGLYLLGAGNTAPTGSHYIDTNVFRANALGSSYDFNMPAGNVTVYAVFEEIPDYTTEYPITTEVIGYPGARLYAYTGTYPYDGDLNDVGAVTEVTLYSTVKVILDASTSEKSINKLLEGYALVGLYLNPTGYPESGHAIDAVFDQDKLEWGTPVEQVYPYGGTTYSFSVNGPSHVVAVVAQTGASVEIPQYTVTYDANGGSGTMANGTAAQGTAFTLPECGFTPPEGQEFKAWSIGGTGYAAGDAYRCTADTTVIAVWEDREPASQTAPVSAPEIDSKTHNSVILLEMASSDVTNAPVEYSKDGGATWQESPVFTGLSAGTTYRFTARYGAVSGYTASPAGPVTEVTTDAAPYTPPYTPPSGSGDDDYTPPSSSDDNDTPSTPSSESVTVPISGEEETIHVEASVSGETATIEEIDLSRLNDVIGGRVNTGAVAIDLTGLDKKVDTVELPVAVVEQIAQAVNDPANDAESLDILFANGTAISFDAASLGEKSAQADGKEITVAVQDADDVSLTSAQKSAVGDRPAYDISVSSGGKPISDMGGLVTMRFPYKLQTGESPGGVVVWYVDENGNQEACVTDYDSENEQVSATTDHLSLYMIGYDPDYIANCPKDESCPMYPYTDVVIDSWYHDGVHYAIVNGLMQGTSTTEMLFSPNGTTTRAQIVTILHRLEGAPAVDYLMQFSDVAEGQWHTEAIRWAASTGITSGTGDGTTFSPNDPITREQFAAFLYRYAQYKGYDVSVGEDTNILSYEDAFTVSEYAYPALQWACGAGIIGGIEKDGSMYLDPQGSATRAQAAVVLMRFAEKAAK